MPSAAVREAEKAVVVAVVVVAEKAAVAMAG